MKTTTLIMTALGLALVACVGCEPVGKPPSFSDHELNQAVTRIDKVCDLSRGATREQTHYVYREMRSATSDLTNQDLLLELFRIYTGKTAAWRGSVHGEVNAYDVARIVLVDRVDPYLNEDIPRILVEMLTDRRIEIGPDGERTLGRAITDCGDPCLPELKAVPGDHARRPFVDTLIDYIERGEIYGMDPPTTQQAP